MAKRQTSLRRCLKCGELKPEERFAKPTWNVCKDCKNKRAKASMMKAIFNITVEEYEQILTHQGGVCAICKKPPKQGGKSLAVDHDHKTGLIRGLLCWACNSFLAKAHDDAAIIMNAAEYVTTPPATVALGEQRLGRKGSVRKRRRKRSK